MRICRSCPGVPEGPVILLPDAGGVAAPPGQGPQPKPRLQRKGGSAIWTLAMLKRNLPLILLMGCLWFGLSGCVSGTNGTAAHTLSGQVTSGSSGLGGVIQTLTITVMSP